MRMGEPKYKLDPMSYPLLIVIPVAVFYIITKYCGPGISTVLMVTGFMVLRALWKRDTTKQKNKHQIGNSDSEISELNYQRLQNENHRLARELERRNEKLSPLKVDNENLQSQIDRQTREIYKLFEDVQREQKSKLILKEEIEHLKETRQLDSEQLQMRLNESTLKNEELEKLIIEKHIENNVLRDEHAKMDEQRRQAVEERMLIEYNWRNEVADIQKQRKMFADFEEEAKRYFRDRESELSIYKNMCAGYEEKIGGLQMSHSYLENARKELEKFQNMKRERDAEIEHLKLRLENSEKTTDIPICSICEDNERNTYLHPCGHTLCSVCTQRVMSRNNKCPNCRHIISKTGPIYFS